MEFAGDAGIETCAAVGSVEESFPVGFEVLGIVKVAFVVDDPSNSVIF